MADLWSDSFVLYALAAGIALALVVGPLGSVVVWRRMAYFGDTLAHAALLGVALAVAAEQLPMAGVGIIGILIAVLLFWLEKQRDLSTDTLLGILSHSTLALGLIVLSVIQSQGFNLNLMSYLFGDLLAVNQSDLILMYGSVLFILLVFSQILSPLISISVNEELARIDGVAVEKIRFIFMILLALVIAVALKVVGILLITALLIIPAATARLFSKSPKQMVFMSVLVAICAVFLGVFSSLNWDFPTGPAIVVSAAILFFVSRVFLNNRD
ncbi:Zinc ABC transporter, permease protein ZnuB [hydrothermal vent metagenome]|uniref:High-affinity zinc uptake system membrane protein ZnuB n=1 Tax=hydrothermal vent metagenome TaxID=652676 RepID=A0A3B0WM00_9ZZZZ